MLDVGVFPWMERQQQESGATTKEEIRGSVMGVWRKLQPSMLKKVADRVRLNCKRSRHAQAAMYKVHVQLQFTSYPLSYTNTRNA